MGPDHACVPRPAVAPANAAIVALSDPVIVGRYFDAVGPEIVTTDALKIEPELLLGPRIAVPHKPFPVASIDEPQPAERGARVRWALVFATSPSRLRPRNAALSRSITWWGHAERESER